MKGFKLISKNIIHFKWKKIDAKVIWTWGQVPYHQKKQITRGFLKEDIFFLLFLFLFSLEKYLNLWCFYSFYLV
jgi:hypothetical protein